MLDIGWQELFFIGVIALIVVGPKDLPRVLRTVSHFVRKARGLAREFQGGVADMVREAELDDIKRQMDGSGRSIEKTIKDTVDPTGSLTEDFDPAEFNRQLKERVEGGPPKRPAETEAGSGNDTPAEAPTEKTAAKPAAKPKPKPKAKTGAKPKPEPKPEPKRKLKQPGTVGPASG
jgi:sec-independent protein translocase protein TatB